MYACRNFYNIMCSNDRCADGFRGVCINQGKWVSDKKLLTHYFFVKENEQI